MRTPARRVVACTAIVMAGVAASAWQLTATAAGTAAGPVTAGQHALQTQGQPANQAATVSTANPITLDPPVDTPPTTPTEVTVVQNAPFGNNPPPATATVTLPAGNWSKVVLDVTGTESGRQFDRLAQVWAGATQIYLGVTPEPTPQGITWHITKDVTGYLPILAGTQTFSVFIDNFLNSTDTGIPSLTVKLLFYPPGGGFGPARTAGPRDLALAGDAINETGPASPDRSPRVPAKIVPLVPPGAVNDWGTILPGQTQTSTVTLPDNVTTATLDLYAVAQINDEFWWSLSPAFRELEITVDGKPAGVVWPAPYVYTGGVNPLIWRPLTGIHTMDIPSYRIDLTPFAAQLSAAGPHTIGITVAGNANFWLAGGDLLLTADGGPVTGGVQSDTLTFPVTSQVSTHNVLGDSTSQAVEEQASETYGITGTIVQDGRTSTDALTQSLRFSNDQTNVNPSCTGPCYQWVHQEMSFSTAETLDHVTRSDQGSWTIDAPNGFLTSNNGSNFFIPATVTQQLTDVAEQGDIRTRLSESIIGYGALEEDGGVSTIADGDTTGTITWQAGDRLFQRTVVTHAGQIVQDLDS